MFSVPIRAVQFLWGAIRPIPDPVAFRELLALWIAPLSTFCSTVLVAAIVRRLVADQINRVLVTAMYCLSFTVLLFGSVPESFPVSNLLITAMLYLALRQQTITQSPWIWRLVGILSASVTITNIAIYSIIRVASSATTSSADRIPILKRVALEVSAIAALVLVTGRLAVVALGYTEEANRSDVGYLSFVSLDFHTVLINIITTLAAVGQSVVGGMPHTRPLTFCGPLPVCRAVEFSKTSLDAQSIIFSVIVLTIIVWFIMKVRDRAINQSLLLSLAGVLCFNLALHAVFGREMILFSGHWITAFVLLLANLPFLAVRICVPIIITVQLFMAAWLFSSLATSVTGM
jgi:hypothetical protein